MGHIYGTDRRGVSVNAVSGSSVSGPDDSVMTRLSPMVGASIIPVCLERGSVLAETMATCNIDSSIGGGEKGTDSSSTEELAGGRKWEVSKTGKS